LVVLLLAEPTKGFWLFPVSTKLVAVFIFNANLYALPPPRLIVVSAIATIAISRPPIHVIIVPTPIPTHGAAVVVLLHCSAHVTLSQAVHIRAIVIAPLCGPISIDPGLLGAPVILFARLIRLLRRALWLNRSVLGLRLVHTRPVRLLSSYRRGNDGTKKHDNSYF
jgi:hypothetical protein